MKITYDYLKEIGFRDFSFLNAEENDANVRLCWMGIINDEIITIRIVLINDVWSIDYISPKKHSNELNNLKLVIEFLLTSTDTGK